jgi:hypothetical protein
VIVPPRFKADSPTFFTLLSVKPNSRDAGDSIVFQTIVQHLKFLDSFTCLLTVPTTSSNTDKVMQMRCWLLVAGAAILSLCNGEVESNCMALATEYCNNATYSACQHAIAPPWVALDDG